MASATLFLVVCIAASWLATAIAGAYVDLVFPDSEFRQLPADVLRFAWGSLGVSFLLSVSSFWPVATEAWQETEKCNSSGKAKRPATVAGHFAVLWFASLGAGLFEQDWRAYCAVAGPSWFVFAVVVIAHASR